jgi:hypothetical protein
MAHSLAYLGYPMSCLERRVVKFIRPCHQRPKKADMQQPERLNVKELNDVPLGTAAVPQPGSPLDHSPIAETGGTPEAASNASKKVADQPPVPQKLDQTLI